MLAKIFSRALIGVEFGLGLLLLFPFDLKKWVIPALIAMLGLAMAVKPIRRVYAGATGADLIDVLVMTGRVQILVAISLSVGLLIS